MRLRHCTQERPPEVFPVKGEKTFQVELITPLYGGGVEAGQPDKEMPIRASAIRGQLRFWWRLLNRDKGFQEEAKIWGGISATEATASRVILSTPNLPRVTPVPCAIYEENKSGDGKLKGPLWQHDIPGYALFPGQGELNKDRTDYKKDENQEPKKPAKVILPPLKFTLQIVVTGKDAEETWKNEIFPALRWWASFGGLGARTRRGLGSVKVKDLPPITEEEAKKFSCTLIQLTPERNATDAWTTAVGRLQQFRQGVGVGRDGRSLWPEADSIRQITECYYLSKYKTTLMVPPEAIPSFPRAVFGLPIIIQFKDGPKKGEDCKVKNFDPAETTLYPVVKNDKKEAEKRNQMASPLILKAMWTDKGYQPIALLLPHNTNMELCLLYKDEKDCHKSNLLPAEVRKNWWTKEKRDAMINSENNPLAGRTSDVLKDFLNFFQGK